MGFKNSVEIVTALPIAECFEVLKEIGSSVKKYKLIDSSPYTFSLIWRKGLGLLTSPIRVRADLRQAISTRTLVCISAELAALGDPFNLTTKAIDLFEKPFREKIGKLSPSSKSGLDGNHNVINSQVPNGTKKCPSCAETIKAEAKKCRFCGEVFESLQIGAFPSTEGNKIALTSPNSKQPDMLMISCPSCNARYRVPKSKLLGAKNIRCLKCKHEFAVPPA